MKETDAMSVAIHMYDDGYDKGYSDAIDKIRDAMTFHQQGLGGYFTISQDEWQEATSKDL